MNRIVWRALCGLLIFLLSGAVETLLAQQPAQSQEQPTQNAPQPPIELPDSPGRTSVPTSSQSQTPPDNQNQNNLPPGRKQPSGTAAAPAVQVTGSAASKPAGVAIAPPKQRQLRTWLIRFGFIAGAGAALGTVAALSAASPSRVPNSPGH
jgi:hypothetical protein